MCHYTTAEERSKLEERKRKGLMSKKTTLKNKKEKAKPKIVSRFMTYEGDIFPIEECLDNFASGTCETLQEAKNDALDILRSTGESGRVLIFKVTLELVSTASAKKQKIEVDFK